MGSPGTSSAAPPAARLPPQAASDWWPSPRSTWRLPPPRAGSPPAGRRHRTPWRVEQARTWREKREGSTGATPGSPGASREVYRSGEEQPKKATGGRLRRAARLEKKELERSSALDRTGIGIRRSRAAIGERRAGVFRIRVLVWGRGRVAHDLSPSRSGFQLL